MRPEKSTMVEEIRGKVAPKGFVILADYAGMDVEKVMTLRSRLRGVDARYSVVKNRLLRRVADDMGLPGLDAGLKGPTAMVSGDGDVVEAAKILKTFIKENDKPVIKSGVFDGRALTAADVEVLASMPPRIEMLGRAVGTIAAPLTQFVGVLNQKVCSLLYVLQAVMEKKEKA